MHSTSPPGLVSERSLTYSGPVPPRAKALPPTQRRAALVDAARSLIRERGEVPSTKDIAEAAGVAEGTLFRAFETKEELIEQVIASTFCPAPLLRQLAEIEIALPLRERLVEVVGVLQRRFSDAFDLMVGLHLSAPPAGAAAGHHACTPEGGHVPSDGGVGPAVCRGPGPREPDRGHAASQVAALIEPDAHLLRCTPLELARYLRLLTFSGSHRGITDGNLLTPETIVDIVLSGVIAQPATRGRAAGTRSSRPTHGPRTRKAP